MPALLVAQFFLWSALPAQQSPDWPTRTVSSLDGLWDFSFYTPAELAPWHAPEAAFTDSESTSMQFCCCIPPSYTTFRGLPFTLCLVGMPVPASIDTRRLYANRRGVAIYRRQIELTTAAAASPARIHFAGCSVHCRVFLDGEGTNIPGASGFVFLYLRTRLVS